MYALKNAHFDSTSFEAGVTKTATGTPKLSYRQVQLVKLSPTLLLFFFFVVFQQATIRLFKEVAQ